jgi:hypothetical protein
MGCHVGWHFPVGCPLRGGRGENKLEELLFHQKQLRKKKVKQCPIICFAPDKKFNLLDF